MTEESSNREPIRAKVAKILNRRELVLNAGAEKGIREGMQFAILNRQGARITDPDTGKELGSVEIPKVFVKVVRLGPKLAVARTFHTTRKNVGGVSGLSAMAELFRPPDIVEVPETLRIAEKSDVAELDPEDSYVRIGDPAVEVIGDEFAGY